MRSQAGGLSIISAPSIRTILDCQLPIGDFSVFRLRPLWLNVELIYHRGHRGKQSAATTQTQQESEERLSFDPAKAASSSFSARRNC